MPSLKKLNFLNYVSEEVPSCLCNVDAGENGDTVAGGRSEPLDSGVLHLAEMTGEYCVTNFYCIAL
jgi:hypothetical protein